MNCKKLFLINLGFSNEDIIKNLNDSNSISLMKSVIQGKYTLQKYIIDFDLLLLDLIVSVMDSDYININSIIGKIVEIIGDNVPVLSDIKNMITTVKNVASVVNELDESSFEKDGVDELQKADELLNVFEARNKLLEYTYEFAISLTFVQKELSDAIT